jgi:hypothetical protein
MQPAPDLTKAPVQETPLGDGIDYWKDDMVKFNECAIRLQQLQSLK